MGNQERYTESSKALNQAINKIAKKYKLTNVETLGLLSAIEIALVQICYTSKVGK